MRGSLSVGAARVRRRGRVLLACAALAMGGCGERTAPAPEVGSPAPAYSATSLAGDPVSLEELRGKVVLLNVWATWCVPCREEIPALQALYEESAGRGLEVVGVSVDAPGSEEAVRDFARRFDLTYPIWLDERGAVTSTFRATGVPNSYLIDREGTIVWKRVGPVEAGDSSLARALRESLAAG